MNNLSLSNLGTGEYYKSAAIELFDKELQNVLGNILDENTKATDIREITLKLKIKPSNKRESSDYELSCVSKLAPIKSFEGSFYLGKEDNKIIARERSEINQLEIDVDQIKIVKMQK